MARPKGSKNKVVAQPSQDAEAAALPAAIDRGPTVSENEAKRVGCTITSRYSEPCKREVWDVAYVVNGEQLVDAGLHSQEAAIAHAALMAKAYGL